MISLTRIVKYLNETLSTDKFNDSANNGLQVENSGTVTKVCCGVDASLEFFEAALREKADLLICHHGISWGDSLRYITNLNYKRLAFLVQNDMALYASHLPLDAHPQLGNNIRICRALGLKGVKKFGNYRGQLIGYEGHFPAPVKYSRFKNMVRQTVGGEIESMDFGKENIRRVAVVSGNAEHELEEAALKGIDVYLSGEPGLVSYNLAREYGINAVFAGHYATELFGITALAGAISKKFKLPVRIIDLKINF